MAQHILIVCSANVCRSPYAEALLRSRLRRAEADPGIELSSAGLQVQPGRPLCDTVATRLDGIDVSDAHRASRLRPELIAEARLVLTAERAHRAAIVQLTPTASSRTFTLREAAALASVSGTADQASPAETNIEMFAARLHGARGLFAPIDLDITDGHLRSRREHRRALDEIDDAIQVIADGLLGLRSTERNRESGP